MFSSVASGPFPTQAPTHATVNTRVPTEPTNGNERLTQFAMAIAAMLMAYQIAGKAARDAVFLSQFPATSLPAMTAAAAITSIIAGFVNTRILSSVHPVRFLPIALALSGILQIAEFLATPARPAVLAVIVYIHIMAFGPILLSSFWSVVAELFDPRAARRSIGRIAGAGTVGGVAGGLLAERTAAIFSTPAVLVTLGCCHLCAAFLLAFFARSAAAKPERDPEPAMPFGEALRSAPYLPMLGAIVLAGTTAAALLDFAFKSQAAATFGKGPELLRYLAAFYTGTAILGFLVQTFLSRIALERAGLAQTIGTMPALAGAGAIVASMIPGLVPITAARGLEQVLRGSLFRAGYELFFTPVPPAQKRSLKTLIDVGFDRMGDMVGAVLVQLLLSLGPGSRMAITGASAIVSAIGFAISTRLDRAYTRAVETGLRARAGKLDIDGLDDVEDYATRSLLLTISPRSISSPNLNAPSASPPAAQAAPPAPVGYDPVLRALAALRSSDAVLIHRVLGEMREPDPALIPQLIQLLGWDEVAPVSRARLRSVARQATGQLLDVLFDPSAEFAIRRRIPQVLAYAKSQRAVTGLIEALADARFEVRFQSARAIDANLQADPSLIVDPAAIFTSVERELSVGRTLWESHRLLDRREEGQHEFLDEVLAERADQSLEHVFSLLALVLSREPLKIAFRALHTGDDLLQALALEYLDTNVPAGLREKLSLVIDRPRGGVKAATLSPEETVQRLMESNKTVMLRLEELEKKRHG